MQTEQNNQGQSDTLYTTGMLVSRTLDKLKAHHDINVKVRVCGVLGAIKRYDRYSLSILTSRDCTVPVNLYFSTDNGNMALAQQLVEGREYILDGLVTLYKENQYIRVQLIPLAAEGVQLPSGQPSEVGGANFLMEMVHLKMDNGYKDIVAPFQKARKEHRMPRLALVCPMSLTAHRDITQGLGTSQSDIAIEACPCNFTDDRAIADRLAMVDCQGYDAVLLSRGGGEALETVDRPPVLKQLAVMRTPVIAGLGHQQDSTAAALLADRACALPHDIGSWLDRTWSDVSAQQKLRDRLYRAEVQMKGMDPKGNPHTKERSFYGLPGTSYDAVRYIIMALTAIGLIRVLAFFI